MTLIQIEQLARNYATARLKLGTELAQMRKEVEAIELDHRSKIRELVSRAANMEAGLSAGLEAAPELFESPRSVVFCGIKVGFKKGKGTITISDPERTLARIRELYDCPENYIHTKETPNKDALEKLPAADLKRLGCALTGAGDQVVIRPMDTELEKAITALLKAAADADAAGRN